MVRMCMAKRCRWTIGLAVAAIIGGTASPPASADDDWGCSTFFKLSSADLIVDHCVHPKGRHAFRLRNMTVDRSLKVRFGACTFTAIGGAAVKTEGWDMTLGPEQAGLHEKSYPRTTETFDIDCAAPQVTDVK